MKPELLYDSKTAFAILDNANEGIIIEEIESRKIGYVNKAACRMFGYSYEEMMELFVNDLYPAESSMHITDNVQKQVQGETLLAQCIPCRKNNNIVFFADIRIAKIAIEDRECNAFFLTDITARVVSERELDMALKEWKAIFDAIPHPTIILDAKHSIVAVNKRLLSLLKKDSCDILNMKCWEVFHGLQTNSPPSGCPFEQMLDSGQIETTDMEMEVFGKWFIVSCTPIFDNSGTLQKVIHIATDITERKRMERQLHESAEKYRDLSIMLETIFDSIPDIIGIQDLDHEIIRYNRAGYDYLKSQPHEVNGKKCFALIGRSSSCEMCATSEVYDSRKPARIERYFPELASWIEIRAYPVFDAQGHMIKIIEHLRDITEIKKAESDKIMYERQLQQSQKLESLGILAGGIAHDFNNLLSGIYGFIGVAHAATHETTTKEYLDTTLKTMNRARSLTQQLLTFSKGGSPEKKTSSLNKFLEETIKFALSGSNVSLDLSIPDDLWLCSYDNNQMGQVIDNMIINAQQAMPKGGTITVRAINRTIEHDEHATLQPGNYIAISISDTGVGISSSIKNSIFDPFFTTKQNGSGLGLATSYSIVKKHGGCIDVESASDRGSTFLIYLPAIQADEAIESDQVTEVTTGTGRILIMDDEEVIRGTLSVMLKLQGYTPVTCIDGDEAVRLYDKSVEEENSFSAIILDLTVPGGSGGKKTINEIRKRDKNIPVFVSSGYAEDPIIQNPALYGFTDSLKKPFSCSELMTVLSKYLVNK